MQGSALLSGAVNGFNSIQFQAKDMPTCLKAATDDGSLPIHLACQFSYDPTLLATLLYYDKSVINAERADGFTPLHLVAARGEVHDVRMGLLRLDEDTQVSHYYFLSSVFKTVSNFRDDAQFLLFCSAFSICSALQILPQFY